VLVLFFMLYTSWAMTLYQMPAESPYERPFRIFGWSSILALLGICLFSIYEPQGLSHFTNVALAWVAGAIVLTAVVLGTVLSTKEGLWKLNRTYQVELSDGKIIQTRAGSPSVEIPLNQIESLHACDVYSDSFGLKYWLYAEDSAVGRKGDLMEIEYGPNRRIEREVAGPS
jgi:hypothetical protein